MASTIASAEPVRRAQSHANDMRVQHRGGGGEQTPALVEISRDSLVRRRAWAHFRRPHPPQDGPIRAIDMWSDAIFSP
ncbi:hypothetical protein CLCR_11111 [Cladophialophora carrionii]|uniref:Uncharacterized protein n=1 Tax=Cladophialophora carrionii TaxID=86049 RepID=A0A1C1CZ98_9EURO|nr:hypothetical protein CLCR_11111 [Cladophialophora carrionii]